MHNWKPQMISTQLIHRGICKLTRKSNAACISKILENVCLAIQTVVYMVKT